jgi:hypothetical protein
VANVELSWLAPSKLRRTVIVGSKKMVVYDDGSSEPIRIFDRGVVYKDPETFGEYKLSYRTATSSPQGRGLRADRQGARRLLPGDQGGTRDGRERPARQGRGAAHRGPPTTRFAAAGGDRGSAGPPLPAPRRRAVPR